MMKMIAGVEKPDSGSIDKKIKIAYKPQYLQNDIDVEVIAVLDKANGNPVEGSMEEEQILETVEKLKKTLQQINQEYFPEVNYKKVCCCIMFYCKKVDLYALDEPSAFLDVEDRIAVAKFLQKFVSFFWEISNNHRS